MTATCSLIKISTINIILNFLNNKYDVESNAKMKPYLFQHGKSKHVIFKKEAMT